MQDFRLRLILKIPAFYVTSGITDGYPDFKTPVETSTTPKQITGLQTKDEFL